MLKTKLTVLSALVVAIMSVSCEKFALDNPVAKDPQPEETNELKFSVKNLHNGENYRNKEGHKDYNFLGYGYDIMGKYAHITSVKEPVINTANFVKDHAGRFTAIRVLSSTFVSIYAPDGEQFTRDLTSFFLSDHKTRDFAYFRGNISQPFPETQINSSKYLYGLYDLQVKYRKLSLNAVSPLLEFYITDDFKSDCQSLTAEKLIEKYGTHTLLTLFTGAKLSLDYQAEYTGSDRRKAVENSFRLGLSDCFGLISGFVDPLDRSTFEDIAQPRITFEAIGGDPSAISVDERSANNPVINMTEWIESINEETARFVYLHDMNGLLPIYNLISDTQKKEEVKDYIDDYLKRNVVKIK
ncbi:hypothetical protein [Sphingobacterium sp. FBM7-1]|uniref:hypothetical protein n=1 Tax=Sphingobacterium sp. FBM7-1 TaxID=2886688 RepID=UPI001D103D3B|nr:hypothetical protein [Sphingobacterium sp. FBM7-1]MCC2599737.1 hypothetical protein [Sphingobacterium sp. FBM7-1]